MAGGALPPDHQHMQSCVNSLFPPETTMYHVVISCAVKQYTHTRATYMQYIIVHSHKGSTDHHGKKIILNCQKGKEAA